MEESSSTFIIIIQHISISISGGWRLGFLRVLFFSFHSFFLVFLRYYLSLSLLQCAGFPPASRNWFVRICRRLPDRE